LDAVSQKLALTTARHLFSTVEWFGTTVATFMADFWLRVHYGVCFIHLQPHLTARPPPTHPRPCYIHPEISAHLKKSVQKPLKPAFMDS